MTEAPDTAGVIAPPPLMLAAAIVLGLLLDWLLPAYVLTVLLSFGDAHRHWRYSDRRRRRARRSRDARLPRGRHPRRAMEAVIERW